jgi:pantoate kinase
MKTAKAFSPGHITGFFEICPAADPLSTGSRGAGLCISLGATSEVQVQDSARQSVDIKLNGRPCRAEVTAQAVRMLLGSHKKKVSVQTRLDLPIGQGFGMSAAGALSAALALASSLGVDARRAFEAAHISEVEQGGGLGDVSAILKGGITVRDRPGLPPIGKVIRIEGQPEIVLCVVGGVITTKSILDDPAKRKAINAIGSKRVDRLLEAPSLERLISMSSEFAVESGLATGKVLDAMNVASKLGMASMSMLGNSVFAVGNTKGLVKVLSDFGSVFTTRVDTVGARVVRPSS